MYTHSSQHHILPGVFKRKRTLTCVITKFGLSKILIAIGLWPTALLLLSISAGDLAGGSCDVGGGLSVARSVTVF